MTTDADVAQRIAACRACDRDDIGVSHLPPLNRGNASSQRLIIGEAPGGTEAEKGQVFCGAAGTRLVNWLSYTGLGADRDDFLTSFYMTSVCKCRLPSQNAWQQASKNCMPFLEEQIKLVSPKVVLILGMRVTRRLFGVCENLDAYFGRPLSEGDLHVPMVPIFPQRAILYILPHPSPQTNPWLAKFDRETKLVDVMRDVGRR
jgi:DNA polymerase